MKLKPVQIRDMDSDIWNRVYMAVVKRRFAGDPNMTMAKWLTEAIRIKLRRENG